MGTTCDWPAEVPENLKDVSSCGGHHMPMQEFLGYVRDHDFIDYDGFGRLATDTGESRSEILPSDITVIKRTPPSWATHVVWYNK